MHGTRETHSPVSAAMVVKHGPSLALNLTCTMPNPRGSLVVRQTEHTFTSTTMGRHSETKRQIFQTGDERHCAIKSNPLAETGVDKKRSTTQESRTHIQPCVRSRRAISGACGIVERLTRREHTFILASSRLPHDSFSCPVYLFNGRQKMNLWGCHSRSRVQGFV